MTSKLIRTALAALALCTVARAAERSPNIILILCDDFGYECVTANGGESYQTPNLDELAATGMRFENCHVQPLCTPSRVELMTGISNVRNYVSFGRLDRNATTFGSLMKQAGYVTGICGKWQLGHEKDSPQHFGFDDAFLWQHTRLQPRYANPGLERNGVEQNYSHGEYGPALINDFALDFIARHKDEPFFLYYPMILTHDPFQPTPDSPDWDPKALGEKVHRDPKHFAEMTAYADKMIGRLVAKLNELGLRENTLVLFVGDNGTGVPNSRFKGQTYPGGKGTRTARGTHVPLIANWPGKIPAGSVNTDLISSVDFLPTLCEAAGTSVPPSLEIDGQSFYPQLLGRRGTPREWLYSWYARNGGSTPKWEYAMNHSYKLYRDGKFYNLAADPFEQKPPQSVADLSGEAAAAAKSLQSVLDLYKDARPERLMTKAGKGKKK